MSKKKIVILIIAIVAVIAIAVGGVNYAKYAEDTKIEFFSMSRNKDNCYMEIISASCSRPGGRSPEKHNEFTQKNKEAYTEFFEKYQSGEYIDPINIHASIEVKDGQTIFTYYGTVTLASGETQEYNRQFTVDYVFTKDIPDVFKVPEK
ncbi:MAG: hypothetical protein GX851_05410 [Clostridiales bacterium]|nr:hypothetical protein [Clostridiales bacterium]